jgi:hypothetical protein
VPPEVLRSANAVLSKPFDLDVLSATLHALVVGTRGPPSPTPPPISP